MSSKRRAILVAGMHRGGTSATAGALGVLGAALPRDLMPPVPGVNDAGFFEPVKIVEVHDELLRQAGSCWHDTSPIPDQWFHGPAAGSFVERLTRLVGEQYGESPLIVLKDPRICRLIPLWLAVLNRLDIEPLFVIPFRHPWEVAASLARRDGFVTEKSEVMWLQHLLLAEQGSRGHVRSFLAYEDLLAAPRTTLTRVGRELGVQWPRSGDEAFAEAAAFLSRDHHHNRVGSVEGTAPRIAVSLVAEAYDCLQGLRGSGGTPSAERLDRILEGYEAADRALGPVVRELRAEADRLGARLADHERTLAAAGVGHDHLLARLHEVLAERDALGRKASAGVGEGGPTPAQAIGADEAIARLTAERDAARRATEVALEERDAARRERDAARQAGKVALEERNAARRETDAARHAGEVAVEERASALRDLEVKASEVLRLQREAAELRNRLREFDRREGILLASLRSPASGPTKRAVDPAPDWRASLRQSGQFATYLRMGAPLGWNPRIHFDAAFYLENNPGLWDRGMSPLEHFLKEGLRDGLDPHRLFRTAYYLELNPDVARMPLSPFLHFLRSGDREGRRSHPLFDPDYYLAKNPEVAASRQGPMLHFLSTGGVEGRRPHPFFDSQYYFEANPAVRATGLNPLDHYLRTGAAQGLNPHPRFDSAYYVASNPDVAAAGMNPLEHYVRFGSQQGRRPHPQFDRVEP